MTNEKLQFYFNNQIYNVNILRTSNKNMYLRIQNNHIVVSAPLKSSLRMIQAFVNIHIFKFINYLEQKQTKSWINYQESFVYIFGEKISFKMLTGFSKSKVININNSLYLQLKNGDHEEIKSYLQKYLKKELHNYVDKRLSHFQKVMNTFNHSFRVINKERSWASNSINKKNLSFALKLIHHHFNTIDYVIVHELAHDFEPNHSSQFWKIVKFYFPNYKDENKRLKNLG